MIKCSDCGIEGIHACLGKPINKDDLPKGVRVMGSGELMKSFKKELDKYDVSKLSQ